MDTRSDPIHVAHIVTVQQSYQFNQYAVFDDTTGDYLREDTGCIKVWMNYESAISHLHYSKKMRDRAWIVIYPSGFMTWIRCDLAGYTAQIRNEKIKDTK